MKKNGKVSIEELTDYEIFKIETQNKIDKYEKELAKNKKVIANLKSRDRVYTKALALCESKINNVKQDSMDKLLFLCENIKEIRKTFYKNLENLENNEVKENFLHIGEEYEYMLNSIYEVCNKIEEDAVFTKSDKELISTKFEMSDLLSVEENDPFAEMKNELRKNIKKGKSSNDKASETSDVDLDDGESIVYSEEPESDDNMSEKETKMISDKFNQMFYEKPAGTSVVSNIKPSSSGFDFNEALNPTMSLSDIMKDLVSPTGLEDDEDEDLDEELSQIESLSKKEDSETSKSRQARMEKIENKMAQNAKFERREDNVPYSEVSEKDKKEEYEKRFTFLQNIFKDIDK